MPTKQGASRMSAIEDRARLTGPRFGGRRLLGQLLLVAMRVSSTMSKFLLAIYTARYLGLADLGIYGLLVGATVIVPAIVGLGMTDWIVRKIVDLPRAQALPLIASRLSLTLSIHLVVQPLAFAADVLLGEPIPLRIAVLCGAILLLDNLGNEAADMLLARRRVFFAYLLTFLRAGAWPIPVMAIGLIYPETRTLEFLLLGWLGMLVVCWLSMVALVLRKGRWRHLRPHVGTLLRDLHGGLVLYVKDVSSTVSMFLDRFLISMFLGLELTGVYTLFWSIANVMHSLSVYGVLQAQLPHIIATAQTADQAGFRTLERHLQIETGIWALLLTLGAAIATPLMLPFLDQPLVQEYLPVFWVILFATLLRVAADAYGFALLALHRDRAIAIIAFGGAIASAGLNLTLTPLAGLWGAAIAFAITSGGLFAARYSFSRTRTFLISGRPAKS
jgi:O-antigen/teichoic acid export membrane protein